jgi:hypothetical protein
VALRISRTFFSALSGMRLLACLIVAPQRGYYEPAILSYAISSFCPTSADGFLTCKGSRMVTLKERPKSRLDAQRVAAGEPMRETPGQGPASMKSSVTGGSDVPAGTLALVRSLLALRCSKEQNALHTLIHQRHLTPSCRGHGLLRRTLDPARMFTESLILGPELENNQDPKRSFACAKASD